MSDGELNELAKLKNEINQLRAAMPEKRNGPVTMMAEKMKLNIGSVLVVCSCLMGGVYKLTMEISSLRNEISAASGDRWKASHQREWSHRLKDGNNYLTVPNSDAVKKDLDSPP